MSTPIAVRCPAKINLALRILGRRADGNHELETVYQTVDLWDTLEVRSAAGLSLRCGDADVPEDGSNLVVRAAGLLRERASVTLGADFHLRKGIPVGGGMGGGSADAAVALIALDRLWRLGLSRAEMTDLGSRLGADVPFFLTGGTALGRGRGERIEPLPFVGEWPLLLGIPPFGISTAEVYRRFDEASDGDRGPERRLTPPTNDVSVTRFLAFKLPEGNDFEFVAHDLEAVVFEGWPELIAFRDALLEVGASRAHLSGSGSTVFGVFPDSATRDAARTALLGAFPEWRLRPTRTIEGAVHDVVSGGV